MIENKVDVIVLKDVQMKLELHKSNFLKTIKDVSNVKYNVDSEVLKHDNLNNRLDNLINALDQIFTAYTDILSVLSDVIATYDDSEINLKKQALLLDDFPTNSNLFTISNNHLSVMEVNTTPVDHLLFTDPEILQVQMDQTKAVVAESESIWDKIGNFFSNLWSDLKEIVSNIFNGHGNKDEEELTESFENNPYIKGIDSKITELKNKNDKLELQEIENQINELENIKDICLKILKDNEYKMLMKNTDYEQLSSIDKFKNFKIDATYGRLLVDEESLTEDKINFFGFAKVLYDDHTYGYNHLNEYFSQNIYLGTIGWDAIVWKYLEDIPYLTDEEIGIYSYLFETRGKDVAEEYFDFMREQINQRKGYDWAQNWLHQYLKEDGTNLDANEVALAIKGFSSGHANFWEGVFNFFGGVDGELSANQYQAIYLLEALKEVGGAEAIYSISSSIGNMTPAIITSIIANSLVPGSGTIIGSSMIGVSVAGNNWESAYQSGHGYYESKFYGYLTGISEATLGYFLGQIPGVSKMKNSSGLVGLLAILFGEGVEESTQSVLDMILQSIILGEKLEIDWDEVAKSGFYGIITAGILNGGKCIVNGVSIAVDDYYKAFSNYDYIDINPKQYVVENQLEFEELYNDADINRQSLLELNQRLYELMKEDGFIKNDLSYDFVEKMGKSNPKLIRSLLLSAVSVPVEDRQLSINELVDKYHITEDTEIGSLSTYHARIWYIWQKGQISSRIDHTQPLEQQARDACNLRNKYRAAARDYMLDEEWAQFLRDNEKNRTFEEIFDYRKGIHNDSVTDDIIYEEILNSALKGREPLNGLFWLDKE